MNEMKQLLAGIKAGKLLPVYFLMGEEPYYIDHIAAYIEQNVLSEEEKDFNQMVMYGRDINVSDIIAAAKRYPMMAQRQLVIIKEAQELSRAIEKLTDYVSAPQPTTILVICYKYKSIDKRKALYKAIKKNGFVFESKKLYENQVSEWIRNQVATKNHSITPKATQMLIEFLGTDLGKIANELDKLQLLLKTGASITPEAIEKNIGISKEYNNFELQKAIGQGNQTKAYRIIHYFGQNPKDNPIVVTLSLLYSFFSKLLQYHGLADKSRSNVASALRIAPFFVPEYQMAAANYPMKKVSKIIAYLRETDLKSKGIGASNLTVKDLLQELLVKIFTKPI